MRREDMLTKNAAHAQRRREQAERRAAWTAQRHAEAAAHSADLAALADSSDKLATLRERRAARGLPVDRETLLRVLPMEIRKGIVGTRWTILHARGEL